MKTQAMNTISTKLATIAILAVAMTCSAQDCDPDPMTAVGAAMIVGGKDGGPSVINDNGRNAFVIGDGKGSGVIFQDRGTTTIWKMGDTTFINQSGNQNAYRNRNQER